MKNLTTKWRMKRFWSKYKVVKMERWRYRKRFFLRQLKAAWEEGRLEFIERWYWWTRSYPLFRLYYALAGFYYGFSTEYTRVTCHMACANKNYREPLFEFEELEYGQGDDYWMKARWTKEDGCYWHPRLI